MSDSAGVRITVSVAPGGGRTGRAQVPLPFTANPGFDVAGGRVLLAAGAELRVRVYEGGELREVFGVESAPRPVSGEHRRAYRRFVEESLPARVRDDYLAALDHPRGPDRLPGYVRLVAADDGRTWARLYAPDPLQAGEWDVFGPDRAWQGRVRTPAGLTVTAIAGRRVAGVWRDSLGVEHVRVYRLRQPM